MLTLAKSDKVIGANKGSGVVLFDRQAVNDCNVKRSTHSAYLGACD